MTNRITKLTERYLEYLLPLLDDGVEIPTGVIIKEHVSPDGVSTLKEVTIKCDCERHSPPSAPWPTQHVIPITL